MRARKRKKQRKKGLKMGMMKTLAPKKAEPTSILSKRKYNVFISNPAKKGSSLMSMVKYNQDSGEIKYEQRKSNSD